jgi:DNA-binding transcriptional LysR family regulator
MRKIESSGLDLNLLIALRSLLKHNQVAAAAHECGVTPSAMSRSLTRLRKAFGDPLLTSVGRSLKPSNRALALVDELDEVLRRIDQLSRPVGFDPLTSDRAFRIACTDYEASVLLRPLVAQLRDKAPRVRLHLFNGGDLGVGVLQDRTAEVAILSPDGHYPWAKRRTLLREEFITLIPKSALPLTRKSYLALPHAVLATDEPEPNPIDALLDKPRRHIACRARSFAMAIELACAGHWAANVPVRLIRDVVLPDHMCLSKPVMPLPSFEVSMFWHVQTDKDVGLQWLRQCIVELAASR